MAEDFEKRKKTWLGLGVVLTVLVAIGLLAVSVIGPPDWLGNRGEFSREVQMPPGTVQPYDPSRPVESISYMGARFEPSGEAVPAPDEEFVIVGLSDDDQYAIYGRQVGEQSGSVSPRDFEGGGGGVEGPPGVPHAEGGVFLRTADGRYQPLIHVD